MEGTHPVAPAGLPAAPHRDPRLPVLHPARPATADRRILDHVPGHRSALAASDSPVVMASGLGAAERTGCRRWGIEGAATPPREEKRFIGEGLLEPSEAEELGLGPRSSWVFLPFTIILGFDGQSLPGGRGRESFLFPCRTDGDGGGGGGEGGEDVSGEGGGQDGGAYEGGKSTRSGDLRAQQPASLPAGLPEDRQHLLPQEHQIGGHGRTEAT